MTPGWNLLHPHVCLLAWCVGFFKWTCMNVITLGGVHVRRCSCDGKETVALGAERLGRSVGLALEACCKPQPELPLQSSGPFGSASFCCKCRNRSRRSKRCTGSKEWSLPAGCWGNGSRTSCRLTDWRSWQAAAPCHHGHDPNWPSQVDAFKATLSRKSCGGWWGQATHEPGRSGT